MRILSSLYKNMVPSVNCLPQISRFSSVCKTTFILWLHFSVNCWPQTWNIFMKLLSSMYKHMYLQAPRLCKLFTTNITFVQFSSVCTMICLLWIPFGVNCLPQILPSFSPVWIRIYLLRFPVHYTITITTVAFPSKKNVQQCFPVAPCCCKLFTINITCMWFHSCMYKHMVLRCQDSVNCVPQISIGAVSLEYAQWFVF